jgi:hypothetical protein
MESVGLGLLLKSIIRIIASTEAHNEMAYFWLDKPNLNNTITDDACQVVFELFLAHHTPCW